VDEDPRVREVLKSGEGICLTLSYIGNRPMDLSLNSLNVRLGILLSVFASSVRLSSPFSRDLPPSPGKSSYYVPRM
jgi:hypothetical protein